MRLIHYKINHYPVFGPPKSSDHNIEVGGQGDLSKNEVRLVKKKIVDNYEDVIDPGNVVICHVMQIKTKGQHNEKDSSI